MTSSGIIPSSDALAEASPDSLSELLSRDPEGYQQQDRAAIISALRAQRERFEVAEREGKKLPKASKASNLITKSEQSAADLGF